MCLGVFHFYLLVWEVHGLFDYCHYTICSLFTSQNSIYPSLIPFSISFIFDDLTYLSLTVWHFNIYYSVIMFSAYLLIYYDMRNWFSCRVYTSVLNKFSSFCFWFSGLVGWFSKLSLVCSVICLPKNFYWTWIFLYLYCTCFFFFQLMNFSQVNWYFTYSWLNAPWWFSLKSWYSIEREHFLVC